MKLIISHDVDVLQTSDHLHDLLMVKRIVRSFIEYALGFASGKNILSRFVDICKNRIHNLDELIAFDRTNNVPSTFFFGMANGMYLNYSLKKAQHWIEKVRATGLQVGVHGIHYENIHDMQKEFDTFKCLTDLNKIGIRMHYLRMVDHTLKDMANIGYAFDASVEKLIAPYKIGNMWEFPLHIMDGSIFNRGARWTNTTFEQAKKITLEMLTKARKLGIPYFTINLHDPNFSPAYPQIYKWYVWLIHHARENGITFTDFSSAINEMNKND